MSDEIEDADAILRMAKWEVRALKHILIGQRVIEFLENLLGGDIEIE